MKLKGKVALVTGGAVRVGRALTLALAEAGCHLFIHYGRSVGPAQETQADAIGLGAEAHIFEADLSDEQAVYSILPEAMAQFGQVDILINNAAVFPETDTFSETDLESWDQLFNINLRAPFLLSQAFAAQIPQDGRGRIINITDARVRQPAVDHFTYRLTKGALWQMTEMMAHELAPRITVNGVALGAVLPPPGEEQSYLDHLAQTRIPLNRAGSARIVADNVLHLLRQEFLTGVIIPIDGGEFL